MSDIRFDIEDADRRRERLRRILGMQDVRRLDTRRVDPPRDSTAWMAAVLVCALIAIITVALAMSAERTTGHEHKAPTPAAVEPR